MSTEAPSIRSSGITAPRTEYFGSPERRRVAIALLKFVFDEYDFAFPTLESHASAAGSQGR